MRNQSIAVLGIAVLVLASVPAIASAPEPGDVKRSPISTHVLDTARGRPANGIAVRLEVREPSGTWLAISRGTTDADGRVGDLFPADQSLKRGVFRLTFEVATYFETQKQPSFYPEITIVFEIRSPTEHYHVPLLLSPYGYSTYRGS